MSDNTTNIVPAKVRQPRKISPFWLLPLVAFIIGALLFFQILQSQGEEISIRFQDGAGISAGKTTIRYQGLQIGLVKKVNFTDEMREVEVTATINPEARKVLRKDTKFWLVRPTASLAGVSGLDALVSGNYITLFPGESSEKEDEFVAESEPPLIPINDGDLLIKLIADDLGSVAVGSSVYFRKVPVGTVADYRFTADQQKIEIDLVINKKYAYFVRKESHFWNISGIKANLSLSNGLAVEMDSLLSIVQGAIAFDSPIDSEAAEQGQVYRLFSNLKAAQRGIEVKVELPTNMGISPNETAVFYQGTKIGVLSSLDSFLPKKTAQTTEKIHGALLIDPSYQDLLREKSVIVLKHPKFTLSSDQFDKLGEIFRGHYFEIIAGEGESSRYFKVQKNDEYLLSRPDMIVFTLMSPQSYGVDKGQGIYYHDVQIGEILKRELKVDGVKFTAVVYPNYRRLLGAKSKFVTLSHLDIAVGLDGVRLNASSPLQWLQGGIRLLEGDNSGDIQKQYPLYKDVESADNDIVTLTKTTTVTLFAEQLSGIDKGAVVLYRDFQVGEVLHITPEQHRFRVDLFIEPKYRHLLTDQSRFWISPALQVDLSTQGLNIQSSPLLRTLKGAISFDNKGTKQKVKQLYASMEKASAKQTYITLSAQNATKLSQGMPIKYMGLTVGKVESIKLDVAKKRVNLTAYIEGQYYPNVAKKGSQFKVISPELSTSGLKNLDAALQNYINVELGTGEHSTHFNLLETADPLNPYQDGLPLTVETTDANGITEDAPVLYRGIEVGKVQSLRLSELGDRVLIQLKIGRPHQHLVRKNSQFWAASGYSMEIGLKGASIHSGTMSQLLNGGIAFSTPSGKVVQPPAEANSRFQLLRKMPEGAVEWNQGIAK